MNRLDALKYADELVGKLSAAPLNSRGYPVDGYKAPTLHERTAEVLRVAEFLLGGKAEDE